VPVPIASIELRAAVPADYHFARTVHHAGMRWIAERLFGWDDASQDEKFERQFALPEVRIIVVQGRDVGYLQAAEKPDALFLKELHVADAFQKLGIGAEVLRRLCAEAQQMRKPVTVGVVKFNPALALYQRLGFRIVGEDAHKFYLRRDASNA
jgi:ribosomal protein S18 acetylase RimI-like enzyme